MTETKYEERCRLTLSRVKTFLRKTMENDQLNALRYGVH